MNRTKKVLSLVLVAVMLCGLILSGSAATQAAGIYEVGPNASLAGGKAQVVGQKTVVSYDTLSSNPTIDVKFRIYMDDIYGSLYGTAMLLTFDADYLRLANGTINYSADTGYGLEDDNGSFVTNFDYVDPSDRTKGAYIMVNANSTVVDKSWLTPDTNGDGYAIELTFHFKATENFANLNPADGTPVKLAVRTSEIGDEPVFDFYTWAINKVTGDLLPKGNLLTEIPAVVTYSGAMVTYDTGDGEQDDMSPFAPSVAVSGSKVTLADGSGLVIPADGSNPKQIFDCWTDGTKNYESGEQVVAPADGLDLVAVYTPDENDDGIADKDQYKLTYKLRAGDEGVLVAPTEATTNGKFLVDGDNKYIFVAKDKKIGTSVVTVDLSAAPAAEKWTVVGYFIGEDKYTAAQLADLALTSDTVVEVRTMPDANENGIDDRENVTLNFYADDAKPGEDPVKSFTVPDGTPYTVYSDPDKTTEAEKGNADENPEDVTLPAVADKLPGTGRLIGWEFEPVYETPGDKTTPIVGVEAYPVYSEDQIVKIPDVIDEDGNVGDFEGPMENGSTAIYNDINGDPLKEVEIGGPDEIQELENPVPGEHDTLPARDDNNNPFKGWDLTGPETVDGETVYYLDPVYEEPIEVSIVDPNKKADPDDDEFVDGFENKEVPADAGYEVKDGDGKTTDSGKIPEDGIIELPADEDMPVRNDEGDIFTGDWTVEEKEGDVNGEPIYVISPVYREPTEDDIDMFVDGAEADGSGVSVLAGFYANDTKASAAFYLAIAGEPATAADISKMSVEANAAFGFEKLARPTAIIGDLSALKYDGTKVVDGVTYGRFVVDYTTVKSGVVKVTLSYKGVTSADGVGHIVVTVADTSKDGTVNSADVTDTVRVINSRVAVPATGSEGEFLYELMNVNKDGRLDSSDVTATVRMINRKVETN